MAGKHGGPWMGAYISRPEGWASRSTCDLQEANLELSPWALLVTQVWMTRESSSSIHARELRGEWDSYKQLGFGKQEPRPGYHSPGPLDASHQGKRLGNIDRVLVNGDRDCDCCVVSASFWSTREGFTSPHLQ